MGKSDDDVAQTQSAAPKTVTVRSFYMDETEITNSEYRQFIHWVRDSIASALLARKSFEANLGEESENTISEYAFKDADTSDISEFTKYTRASNFQHPTRNALCAFLGTLCISLCTFAWRTAFHLQLHRALWRSATTR